MLICGIDDAGRGPVIGPMVLVGICIEEKDESKLKALKVRDSKLLTPKKREELYKKILKIAKSYEISVTQPKEIDSTNYQGINLNDLEAIKSANIINILSPDKVFIDCPSPNKKAWQNYVYERLKNKDIKLIVDHKAESKFPVVAAASIIAKVTRDAEIEKIKKQVKIDFGTGYPHDEKTIEFLKENLEKYPEIFRKTWATVKNHKNEKKQKKLEDF